MLDWSLLKPVQAMAANHLLRHKKLLLNLPRQEGKTELGVMMLEDITSRPFTSSSLFIAKTHDAGKKATREKFMRLFDKKVFEINTDLVYLKKHPTSAIFMGSADREPDTQRGGTYSFVHGSEVAFWKLVHGETVMGFIEKVLKPTTSKTGGYQFFESTNRGKNGWYDLWQAAPDLGFKRLKLSLSDLLYLGLVTEDYYNTIKDETLPLVFRQEFECEWVSFLGLAYDEFDERTHVLDFPPPEDWQITVSGIDWGYNPSATCVLFAYVRNGSLFIYDEIYAKEQRTDQTSQAIKDRWMHYNVQEFAAVADHEQDRIDELNLAGIACGKANKANVLGARMQIKTLLWKNKIKIHPRCKNLIRDLQAACWDQKKDGELDYGQCTWGHFDAEAALRYLVRELGVFEKKAPIVNPVQGDDASTRAWLFFEKARRAMEAA